MSGGSRLGVKVLLRLLLASFGARLRLRAPARPDIGSTSPLPPAPVPGSLPSHVDVGRLRQPPAQVQASVPGRAVRGQDLAHHQVHVRLLRQHLPGKDEKRGQEVAVAYAYLSFDT